jgi:cardiolipin synthase
LFSLALLVFFIAAISDSLDGLCARYFNQYTEFGTYLDPIADKLLLSSAFVSLAILKLLPAWLAVIVLSRDILIVIGIAVFAITDIHIELKPSLVSRFTTVFQMLTILISLLDLTFFKVDTLKWSLFYLTTVITITSGLHYIYFGLNVLQDAFGNNQTRRGL